MGCDIHTLIQIKKDGKWENIAVDVYNGRNYHLFAVLANVRNGYGFAGSSTSEKWEVLYEPRGLPEDLIIDEDNCVNFVHKREFRNKSENEYWIGDHSYSYLSLKEIKNMFNHFKDKNYIQFGMISEEQYDLYTKNNIIPTNWYGFTNQKGYIEACWNAPCLDALNLYLLIEIIENHKRNQLVELDENIRMVFGFDS